MGTKITPFNLHTSVDSHVKGLIDSDYVQARSGSGGTDSASTQAMIDSNFAHDITFGGAAGTQAYTFDGSDVIFDSSGIMAFDKSEKLLKLGDASSIIIGDDNDLKLSHSAGSGVIRNQTSGRIYLQSNNTTDGVIITKELAAETMAKFRADGPVELYHNNVKKLETTAYGSTVTGTMNADSATFTNVTGTLQTAAQTNVTSLGTLTGLTVGGDVTFDSASAILFDKSDQALKFGDNYKAKFGASGDLEIYHDTVNGNSVIHDNGSGNLRIRANDFQVTNAAASANLIFANDGTGEVKLYHNGSEKIATASGGIDVTGNLTVNDKMQIKPSASSSEIYEIAIDSANTGGFTGLDFKMDNNLIQRFNTGMSGQAVQFHKDVYLENGTKLYFDGSIDDANHTQLTVQNPTADRTITLPNMTGGIKELLISEGSMNSTSLVFNSGTITTEYSELRLVLSNCKPSSQAGVYMRVGSSNSGDGGTNYGQAIYYTGYYGSATAYTVSYVDHDATYFILSEGYAQLGTGTGQNGHFEITFLNPNTSSHYKLFKINSQIYSYYPMLMGRNSDAAVWKSTSAINYIQVYPGGGVNLALEYKLYGVKS